MDQPKETNQEGEGVPNRYSWMSALSFWVFISVAAWTVVVGVVYVLTADTSQVADDVKGLQEIAPAAGPQSTPPKQ
jgi:hypothetical protein